MALFGNKKEAKQEAKPKKERSVVRVEAERDYAHVIVRPIITEKAALLGEKNVYAFEIARNATKRDVAGAVRKLWNVSPVKVAVVTRKPRTFVSRTRGKNGTHPGMKKAYVYLKEGDRIELV